jgi:DNA-directed RNA polymerase specialized sigma24 family protein
VITPRCELHGPIPSRDSHYGEARTRITFARSVLVERPRRFGRLPVVDAALDSTAAGRPNFFTMQWGMVTTASAEGTTEARAALDGLYRVYCYLVYAFIRRRGYCRQDAQDPTQDFFVHLLEKGTLVRADPQRGRFRSFLLTALDYFLAHAAERARAGKRGGGCQWVFLDDEAAENSYQVAAPEGMTAEITDALSLSLGALKTTIHRLRGRYRELLREEVARTITKPAEVEEELRYIRAALGG